VSDQRATVRLHVVDRELAERGAGARDDRALEVIGLGPVRLHERFAEQRVHVPDPGEQEVLPLRHADAPVAVGPGESRDLEPFVVGEPAHRDAQAHHVGAVAVLTHAEVVLELARPERLAGPRDLVREAAAELLGDPVGAELMDEHSEAIDGLVLEIPKVAVGLERGAHRVRHTVGRDE